MARTFAHRPVLLDESLELLDLAPVATVVDGTVGGGGHALAILERLGPEGRLIALDLDAEALAAAEAKLAPHSDRVRLIHASFRDLTSVLASLSIDKVDAVLLDLGVSSYQLDTAERGFRFSGNAPSPLDMRLDPESGDTAATLLASRNAAELQLVFQRYGELPGSARLARAIVEARREAPLRTQRDLVRVIDDAAIGRGRKHHPATLVFQALRIAVNDEIGALEEGLEAATEALRPGGRLVVLAYHSVEDRVVKNHFRDAARGCTCPPRIPVCVCGGRVRLRVVTRRPITPSDDERNANPRARSARLRAAERIDEAA